MPHMRSTHPLRGSQIVLDSMRLLCTSKVRVRYLQASQIEHETRREILNIFEHSEEIRTTATAVTPQRIKNRCTSAKGGKLRALSVSVFFARAWGAVSFSLSLSLSLDMPLRYMTQNEASAFRALCTTWNLAHHCTCDRLCYSYLKQHGSHVANVNYSETICTWPLRPLFKKNLPHRICWRQSQNAPPAR